MQNNLLSIEKSLRKKVKKSLFSQGYSFQNHSFCFPSADRKKIRKIHNLPRAEKINKNIRFIEEFTAKAKEFMRSAYEIKIQKIKPRLIQVKEGTVEADLFRWWNLTWWSLPYEKSYGRQMRFLVWDDHHQAPAGLIGLQSPILRWSVRDRYLNIAPEQREVLINQSMNAQRLGALPPYNKFLCGKLTASLMTSNYIRKSFNKKYKDYKTLIRKRKLPAELLFITTTGAYGKSSVYNRLKDNQGKICEFIGWTNGSGSFHIPDSIYEELILYLKRKGFPAERSFGNGPSVKMQNISQAMRLLGFQNGSKHGIKRAVYLFRFAKNLENIIRGEKRPLWHNRETDNIIDYWKERWAVKRSPLNYPEEKLKFSKKEFLFHLKEDIIKCKKLLKNGFK